MIFVQKKKTKRIKVGWSSFNRYSYFTSQRIPMRLKAAVRILHRTVTLIWLRNMGNEEKGNGRVKNDSTRNDEEDVGCNPFGSSNAWGQNTAKLPDVVCRAIKRKWMWATRVTSTEDEIWTRRITAGRPWTWKRSSGRLKMRWRDS
ncbi:hypothetical protein Aduo_005115 [Ancylostoma duodenale]